MELNSERWVRDKVDSGVSTYDKINSFRRDKWFELMEEYAQELVRKSTTPKVDSDN